MFPMSPPKSCIPMGRSYSKISSFCLLLAASRIRPSEEMNSVYIRSAPPSLHTARNGGSLTSSMGASSNGNSPSSMLPILTIRFLSILCPSLPCYILRRIVSVPESTHKGRTGAKLMQIIMTEEGHVKRESHSLKAVTILVVALFGFMFIGPLVGTFLALPFYDGSLMTFMEDLVNPYGNEDMKLIHYIVQG